MASPNLGYWIQEKWRMSPDGACTIINIAQALFGPTLVVY